MAFVRQKGGSYDFASSPLAFVILSLFPSPSCSNLLNTQPRRQLRGGRNIRLRKSQMNIRGKRNSINLFFFFVAGVNNDLKSITKKPLHEFCDTKIHNNIIWEQSAL